MITELKLSWGSFALWAIAAITTIAVLALCVIYALYPGYLDHGEPIIAMAASKMLLGQQVYPSFESSYFTSNIYGPYLYLLNGLFLSLFGQSIMGGKLAGLVASFGSIVLCFLTYAKSSHESQIKWIASLMLGGFILSNLPYSVWNRPDPFLLLLVALSVYLMRSDARFLSPGIRATLIGTLGGIACGFKLYAAVFILPVAIWHLMETKSFRCAGLMALSGIVVALGPFLIPVFSLSGFLEWFSLVAAKVSTMEMFSRATRYGTFLILPALIFILLRVRSFDRVKARFLDPLLGYSIFMFAGIGMCIYLASKPGAGAYYLMPFAPIAVDMIVRIFEYREVKPRVSLGLRAFMYLLIVGLLITTIPVVKRFYRALDWQYADAVVTDLKHIVRNYPDSSIEMALGDTIAGYKNGMFKSVLVFAGKPYTIDFGIMIETSNLGVEVSENVVRSLDMCRTDIWLVPKGEQPLELVGYYGNQVVDDHFRKVFSNRYIRSNHSEYFDVWSCR